MIVLESLFPIFLLLLFGAYLKHRGLTDAVFLATADKLIYYFFFPVMLFWKIGGATFQDGIDWNFCIAALSTIAAMFVLSTAAIILFRITAFQSGSFSQSCYRFNTYIGVAVILNSLGTEGMKHFGVLIGLAIPLINIFAVSILIWFSGRDLTVRRRMTFLIMALIGNPLILACLAGIIYSRLFGHFPVFIDNALRLVSMAALPLALISIGGTLTFAGIREHYRVALLGSIIKLAVQPIAGYGFLLLFGVEGIAFRVAMIFFALPASTAIYVLSSQMNSDTNLASSAIVLSTVLSFVSLSIVLSL